MKIVIYPAGTEIPPNKTPEFECYTRNHRDSVNPAPVGHNGAAAIGVEAGLRRHARRCSDIHQEYRAAASIAS